MPRTAREIPKEIGAFGEKQFHDTGADLVEVLRVKASTMRKHFKQLKGISFLVSVIQTDRVRVYFFTSTGNLLIGENLNHETYSKIRKTSRLVTKFVKPKPPTEEELRMEATEDLRQLISRSLRRVARSLGRTEPPFPTVYVSKASLPAEGQGFGVLQEDDGSLVFEQAGLDSAWGSAIVTRASFLQLLSQERRTSEISNCIGNGYAYTAISAEAKTIWHEAWAKQSRETDLAPFVSHLVKHAESYRWKGFESLVQLLNALHPNPDLSETSRALTMFHDTFEIGLGHDERMTIQGFCKSLQKPKKLAARRYTIPAIHLSPRIWCDPTPLGITLHATECKGPDANGGDWLTIQYLAGSERRSIVLLEDGDNPVTSLHYRLGLEDVFPKSGGLMSHGHDILAWILNSVGLKSKIEATFEAEIHFSEKELARAEKAVLERLSEGSLQVISDTLVGSPQRVNTLHSSERIVFLPDFNHLGLKPNFLVIGEESSLTNLRDLCLESTMIGAQQECYMIAAAPNVWGRRLLDAVVGQSLTAWPILEARSNRRIIRTEFAIPKDPDAASWDTV